MNWRGEAGVVCAHACAVHSVAGLRPHTHAGGQACIHTHRGADVPHEGERGPHLLPVPLSTTTTTPPPPPPPPTPSSAWRPAAGSRPGPRPAGGGGRGRKKGHEGVRGGRARGRRPGALALVLLPLWAGAPPPPGRGSLGSMTCRAPPVGMPPWPAAQPPPTAAMKPRPPLTPSMTCCSMCSYSSLKETSDS